MSLALITAASSGIGLELAKQFAQHGHDIVIAAEDDGIEAAATTLSRFNVDLDAGRQLVRTEITR